MFWNLSMPHLLDKLTICKTGLATAGDLADKSYRLDHAGEYKTVTSTRLCEPVIQNVTQTNLHMNNNVSIKCCSLFNPISGMSKSFVIINSLLIELTAVIWEGGDGNYWTDII